MTFAVADTGAGIPSSLHDRIFEKFAQVEGASVPAPGGAVRRAFSTGLGLTYCKMATEAHGGRIWFESEEKRGTTFSVVVPDGTDRRVGDRRGQEHAPQRLNLHAGP